MNLPSIAARGKLARLAACLGLVGLVAAGCGNRLPHDEVVKAATPAPAAVAPIAAENSAALAGEPSGADAPAGPGTAPADDPAANDPATGTPAGGSNAPAAGGSGTGAGAGGTASVPARAASPGRTGNPASGPAAGSTAPRESTAGAPAGGGPAPNTPGPANPTRAPVVIGNVGTYSGVLGGIFSGGRTMAQVWARSVNARGGLAGHPVRMVVADDGADPARNAAVVRDMVENQGAIAFVGNIVPLSISGSQKYLEANQIPVVGGEGAIRTWWESPVFFPHTTFIDTGISGGIYVGVREGRKRFGLLYCAEAAACNNGKKVLVDEDGAARAGGQIVYQSQISLAQPDFTAECIAANNAGVDALAILADGNTVARVARSCSQQGYKPLLVSFGLALVNDLQKDPNLEGLVGSNIQFPWMISDTPATAEYAQAIKTYAPSLESSGATATVWSAGKLLEAAVRNAGGTVTSQSIMEGLWAMKGETVGGLTPPLTFAKGRPSPKSPCYWWIRLSGGRWTAPDGMKLLCPPETAPT